MSLKAELSRDKKQLVVTIDCNVVDPPPSSTGKTLLIASTHGNQKTELQVNGQVVTLGLSAYIKNPQAPKGGE